MCIRVDGIPKVRPGKMVASITALVRTLAEGSTDAEKSKYSIYMGQ